MNQDQEMERVQGRGNLTNAGAHPCCRAQQPPEGVRRLLHDVLVSEVRRRGGVKECQALGMPEGVCIRHPYACLHTHYQL